MSDDISRNKRGRPRKGEPPRIAYDQLDQLLVHGEVTPTGDGEGSTVVYPSYRELAARFGCAHSLISHYSKKHDCLRRREQAKARVIAKADEKLIELRSTAVALGRDDELRIIDSYLAGFEEALAEGKVRFDNPSDFNTMVRLKQFVQGGADSRQEVNGVLSLEAIQARHQAMARITSSAAERGEMLELPSGEPIETEPVPAEVDADVAENSGQAQDQFWAPSLGKMSSRESERA
jgi:hypothetical protein